MEWKGLKVTVGGTRKTVPPPPPAPPPQSAKVVFICTTGIALAGVAFGVIACWRERSYMVAVPGVALCSLALLWHYVLLGVVVAVAFVLLIILLGAFADALPV